jgi:hypothetical protein
MSFPAEITHADVSALLASQGHEASEEQIAAVLDFVRQVGSIEKAQQALAVIGELKRAA